MLFFQTKDLDNKIKECFIDKNTGLNNGTGLMYLMENMHHQYERYEENWSFIMFEANMEKNIRSSCLDITQKDINKAVSSTLRKICRNSDIIAFCGNNKFCILTRVFEGDDIVRFANKILKNLKNIYFKDCIIDINSKFGITFSKHLDTLDSFISRAEIALKKAMETKENIVLEV